MPHQSAYIINETTRQDKQQKPNNNRYFLKPKLNVFSLTNNSKNQNCIT